MMMLSEASMVMKGLHYGEDARFESVEIDTRRIEVNALYFAIHGASKNGHDYIRQAIAQGAEAAVVDQSFADEAAISHIKVDDTTIALGMLATDWRRRFDVPVVGITGSNGKTTVCKIVSCLFEEHIPGIMPMGSFNNHWGVPLTLLKLRQHHQSAVIEMGMNHAGELSYLGKIVAPDIALITNAAAAHLEGLKTIEGVAQAKGELIDCVSDQGTVILNRDDDFFPQWRARAGDLKCISFGEHMDADVRVVGSEGFSLSLSIKGKATAFEYPLIGRHNRLNAAAAVAVAVEAGVPIEAIETGLKNVKAVPGRLSAFQLTAGLLLIDDSYNANQASMYAAIDVLACQAGQKVLVLGAMGELGTDSEQIHKAAGAYAKDKGIDRVFVLVDQGQAEYLQDIAAYLEGFGPRAATCDSVTVLLEKLKVIESPATILVKGSRFTRMERVVEALRATGEKSC